MNIVISQLELYPEESPTGFAVAFTVTTPRGRVFNQDVLVDFASLPASPTDNEIVRAAWRSLRRTIRDRTSKLDRESLSLVGREWTPPVEQDEGV